jgi:large subunit ribosomal protein L9
MKLLLRKDIPDLGLCGDVVDVSAGYARNYLLPHHLALEPTRVNLKAIEEDKKLAAADRERRHAFLTSMSKRLSGVEVTISASCTPEGHLYGSVGPSEISHALMDEGHSVHPDQIKMSQNIKEVGTLEVPILLADGIGAEIKVWVVAERGAGDIEEPQAEATDVTDDSAVDRPDPGAGATAPGAADTNPSSVDAGPSGG